MAGISIIVTKQGFIVSEAGAAADAAYQRISGAISTGEASQIIVEKASDGTPIISGALDVQTISDLTTDGATANWNAH